jgi:flavin-dependent dehydrogenase
VLGRIANTRGLLVGDAAGAVSPLTAGGLDPCLRLSTFAASTIDAYLRTRNAETLSAYNGELFRSRFISRLWMRRVIAAIQSTMFLEFGCALMRLPILDAFAWHVFFGRGSFPDLKPTLRSEQLAVLTQ